MDASCIEKLKSLKRDFLMLEIGDPAAYEKGGTRFGGNPDVPADFDWPFGKNRNKSGTHPLSFIAQFDCSDLSRYESAGLLPEKGVLSFFYDKIDQPWGISPDEFSGARVYWFPDSSLLNPAPFPSCLDDYFRFPSLKIRVEEHCSYPSLEDFLTLFPNESENGYFEALAKLSKGCSSLSSKLLGWPDVIQDSMAVSCELVRNGLSLRNIPYEKRKEFIDSALGSWLLLFQLDMVESGDFSFMLGDCGMLYYLIRKEDLLSFRFENAHAIVQCY